MDFDASPVLRGECSQNELALRLADMVASVASGELTKSEAMGHHEFFVPYKYQDKAVVGPRACER